MFNLRRNEKSWLIFAGVVFAFMLIVILTTLPIQTLYRVAAVMAVVFIVALFLAVAAAGIICIGPLFVRFYKALFDIEEKEHSVKDLTDASDGVHKR